MASRNRSSGVVVALAGLVIASWLLFSHRRSDDADRKSTVVSTASKTSDGNDRVPPSNIAASTVGPPSGFVERTIPLTLENARNLLPLVESTDGRDDAASLGARAQALDECQFVAVARNSFGNFETNDPALVDEYGEKLPIVRRYVKTYLGRCVDLAQARGARGAEVHAALEAAADAGNLWAKARLFSHNWRDLPSDDFDAMVSSLLAARDPDALAAMAEMMVRPHPDSRYSELSGSALDNWAWMLAACDLGKRCGADDALMRSMCIFGGMCGTFADLRQFLQDSMPDDIATIERQEQAILAATASGR
jgi:hypothetical protein